MRSYALRIIELQKALKLCLDAMEKSVEVGCTDNLDCCDDAGKFWETALSKGKKVLEDK